MSLFDKIYDLTYMPLLTPYNLIDTLKLDNYISLNMKKNNEGICSKITCLIDNEEMSFYYQFGIDDKLLTIYYYESNVVNYLFNRNESLLSCRNEYTKMPNAL